MVDIKNEIWKETYLSPYYLISNMGRVKSIERDVHTFSRGIHRTRHKKEKLLTPNDVHGYYHVGFLTLEGKHVNPLVHQLVMYAFKERRNYPEWEIDHINGDTHDNRLENLEYVSSSENTKRAFALGLQSKEALSLANNSRKMTPQQIVEMKETFLKEGRVWGLGHNNRDFLERYAKLYNMKTGSIQNILTGRTNRFFGEDIVQTTKAVYPKLIINEDTFKDCKTFKDKCEIIARHFGLSIAGVASCYYHNKMSLEEIINYYNRRYSCNENCSSKG